LLHGAVRHGVARLGLKGGAALLLDKVVDATLKSTPLDALAYCSRLGACAIVVASCSSSGAPSTQPPSTHLRLSPQQGVAAVVVTVLAVDVLTFRLGFGRCR
jgi:hypothetical protein